MISAAGRGVSGEAAWPRALPLGPAAAAAVCWGEEGCEANVDGEAARSTCGVVALRRILARRGGVAVAGPLNHMPLGRELLLSGLRSWQRFEVRVGTGCALFNSPGCYQTQPRVNGNVFA